MATYEERAQAIMATLRENNVTRTLPDTRTGRLVNTPFDDNDLHGLAMHVLFADAVVRQAPTEPAVRAFNGYTVEQVSLAMDFLEAIVAERKRAHEKHGATSMEQSGLLEHRRASILAEEAVECGKALNDHEHGEILLQPSVAMLGNPVPTADALDKELVQTAAMAYAWWANRRGHRLSSPKPAPERPTTWEEGECPIRVGWHHAAHRVTKDCVRSRTLDASTAEPAPPPVPKAPTIPVLINGTPYTGTLDPATGTLHVHALDGPFGRTIEDLRLHEVSFVAGPPDPSKGIHPILSVSPPINPGDPKYTTTDQYKAKFPERFPPLTDDEGGRRGD